MLINILLIFFGLALVVYGAELLVDGSTAIARKFGVSEFVIGLTIVGFGTSCPELVVSVIGALEGNSDIAVGNVLGSNIFNTLFILGIAAIILPIKITETNRKRDIPAAFLVTLLFICTGMSKTLFGIGEADNLTRTEGIVLLLLFVTYLFLSFRSKQDDSVKESGKNKNLAVSTGMILAGLAGLIFGGRFFVNNSVELAKAAGISDKFIAMTVLACGTSLPELATTIVAASKKKGQLALGNILGSNVFNILLILGVSATITPISLCNVNIVDIGALALSILIVLLASSTFQKNTLDRKEGLLLVAVFLAYYAWLFYKL